MMGISSVLWGQSVQSAAVSGTKKTNTSSSFAAFLKADEQNVREKSAASRTNSSSFFSRIGGSGILKSVAMNGSLGKHLQQLQTKIAGILKNCGANLEQKIDLALGNGGFTVTSNNNDAELIEAALNNTGDMTRLASETASEAADYAKQVAKTKLRITPQDETDDDEDKKKKNIKPMWVEIESKIDDSFGKFSFDNGVLSSASVTVAENLSF